MDLPTRLGVGANATSINGHDAFAIIYSNSSVWGGGGVLPCVKQIIGIEFY